MKLVAALLAILILTGASKPPDSSAEKISPIDQGTTAAPNQTAEKQNRGSQESPLFVKTVPTPQTAEEREEETKQRNEKAAMDGRLVALTGDLASYTLALAFATGLLFLATSGLVYVGFKQVRDARAAIAAAVASAKAAEKSASVAERSLLELETPYLYPVDIKWCLSLEGESALIRGERIKETNIKFSIKNFGKTAATVRSVAFVAVHWTEMPDSMPENYFHRTITQALLDANSILLKRLDAPLLPLSGESIKSIKAKQSFVFLYGEVLFADIFGNDYQQTFCLALDPDERRGFYAWTAEYNQRKRIKLPINSRPRPVQEVGVSVSRYNEEI